MKFLVDAQLPVLLSNFLKEKGFDSVHTDEFPDKERTSDSYIRKIAAYENRIVITKDTDFENSFFLSKSPRQLLLITTGNLSNKILLDLFNKNLTAIVKLFAEYNFIELDNLGLNVHE